MITNCLLVIGNNSPWNLVKETILIPRFGIHAEKSRANDLQGVLDEIGRLRSQVVIIEVEAIPDDPYTICDIYKSNSDLKIILVARNSNYVRVLRGTDVMIKSASEFLDIIRSVS